MALAIPKQTILCSSFCIQSVRGNGNETPPNNHPNPELLDSQRVRDCQGCYPAERIENLG
jgi:hypothetical protein